MQGAAKLTTIVSFNETTGEMPYGALVRGKDNSFYGTTYSGGNGYGTVFRMTTNGAITVWSPFTEHGVHPATALVEGFDGDFYGTTAWTILSTNESFYQTNWGTVFKITTNGTLTTLVSFNGENGAHSEGELIQATDGYFYGTTSRGGMNNLGTVFRMNSEGELTTLISFDGTNGAVPRAGLIQGADGNLYGTTSEGGSTFPRFGGAGSIFKIATNGSLTTLVSFDLFGPFGYNPNGTLLQGIDGSLYGTTFYGGNGYGTVFKVTTNGVYTHLFSFNETNGAYPRCKLVQHTDGTLYGTTQAGGSNTSEYGGAGTIFKITTGGVFINLISFDFGFNGVGHGWGPMAGLTKGADGNFYGVTVQNGTVFRLENFTSNPFALAKGEFAGLFHEPGGVRHESSGYFSAKVSDRGRYTARLLNNGKTFTFSGSFDSGGHATKDIVRHGTNLLHVEFHLDLVNGTDQITGKVSHGDWTADLLANRLVFSTKGNPTPEAGKHTVVIFNTFPPLDAPDGTGFGTISLHSNGRLRMQGALADATPMSQATFLSKDGTWPLYVPLYRGKGSILCWVRFVSDDFTDDYVNWFKPSIPKARFYPDGFMIQRRLICAPYNYTNRFDPIFGFTDGRIYFAPWSGPFENSAIFGPGNRFRNTGDNPMTLTINQSNGRFSGTVVEPNNGKRLFFRGVVLERDAGYGFILDSGLSGQVEIGH